MSMEINSNYNHLKTDYTERVKEKQDSDRIENAKETDTGKAFERQDEYISSEKSGAKPTGLYQVGQDENGNRKIFYEDPNKSAKTDEGKQAGVKENSPENSKDSRQQNVNGDSAGEAEEKCIGNTDKVEREIRKLKEQKQQLERQLQSADGDEKKVRELEKKLAQVENELSQKDTEAYRRQNTVFTN